MDIFYDLPDLNRIFPAIRLHTAAAVNTEWCKRGNGVKEAMLSVHYPAAFRLQETMASELLRPVRSDCGQQDASVGFVLCQLLTSSSVIIMCSSFFVCLPGKGKEES